MDWFVTLRRLRLASMPSMAICTCCEKAADEDFVRLPSRPEIVICLRCLDWLNSQRTKKVAATGGAVAIVAVEPIFNVTDVNRASDHYRRLGFTSLQHGEAYAVFQRDDLIIALVGGDDQRRKIAGAFYLHVDDADQLADEWRGAGVAVVGPVDYDYGKREGSHTDPDGNLIRFGSPSPKPVPN